MVKLPPKASSSFQGLQGTRALHEGVLRWRLLKDARNVTIRAQAVVEGLLTGPDNAIAGKATPDLPPPLQALRADIPVGHSVPACL